MKNLEKVFKALADKTRLQILALLFNEGELSVSDFKNILNITQSKVSRHLRYLYNNGLLEERRVAIWIFYKIKENLSPEGKLIISLTRNAAESDLFNDLYIDLNNWRRKKKN